MKKYLFFLLFVVFGCFHSNAQGFQFLFNPNLNQYDHTGFYVNANKMILGGQYYHPTTFRTTGVIMTSDTLATVSSSWTLDEPNGWGLKNIRRIDANNTLICGGSSMFPNTGLIAKMNHTTGAIAYSKYYGANTGVFGASFGINDAITLSNGDFAVVGNMSENMAASPPCPSPLCPGPSGYGYLRSWFGTSSYARGDDVCLIRTDGNADSLWVRKYHLAYDGNGTFVWCASPTNAADSSRGDSPTKVIEVGGNIFITGFTIDYNRLCQGTTRDPQTFLMKVNSSGTLQWCKTYYIGASPQQEYGVNLAAVTSDATNDIIVLSRSDNSGNVEVCRVQNATGNIVWAKSYDCGAGDRGWGLKETADGKFIISITSNIGAIGTYEMILLKIDRDGVVLNAKGLGTTNMDGTDSWAWYGPDADIFSQGTYAIAGVTNFSGGATGNSYVCKIANQSFSTGCPSHEFNVTVTVINRNAGGVNQLQMRTPLTYETRGGATKGNLALVATPFVPTATNPCLLPVELLSFSGKKVSKEQNLLSWTTASEENNHYFTLERSLDGKEFLTAGIVSGAGNSSTIGNYELMDNIQLLTGHSSIIYYRLRQTDYDGKFTYSHIISIQETEMEVFSVFTDPDKNTAQFSFVVYRDQKISLALFDILGNKILAKELEAEKGFNKTDIALSGLTSGSYLATLTSEGQRLSRKFIYNSSK